MPQARLSPTGWLNPIRILLTLMLLGDLLYLPLALLPHGSYPVGSVATGRIFGPDAVVHRDLPDLSPAWLVVQPGHETYLHQVLYQLGHGLAVSLVSIPMIVMTQRLVLAAMRDDPFTTAMVRRLRILGFVILAGGALASVVGYVASVVLLRVSVPASVLPEAIPDVQLPLWWLLVSFVIFAIAEVVHRGCALRAELDEVI